MTVAVGLPRRGNKYWRYCMHSARIRQGWRFAVPIGLVAALATVIALATGASAAAAPSSTVVVNEVYGGGGNSGATYTNDFIELANRGSSAVDLSGYSVQYHSSSATGSWQVTQLTGSIP